MEAECDRDQARADRDAAMAMVEERDDQARTVRELRAEVATLQEDRQRLAARWNGAKVAGDADRARSAARRLRIRVLTHRLREARREMARVAEQHGPLFVHAEGCDGGCWNRVPYRGRCGGRWVR